VVKDVLGEKNKGKLREKRPFSQTSAGGVINGRMTQLVELENFGNKKGGRGVLGDNVNATRHPKMSDKGLKGEGAHLSTSGSWRILGKEATFDWGIKKVFKNKQNAIQQTSGCGIKKNATGESGCPDFGSFKLPADQNSRMTEKKKKKKKKKRDSKKKKKKPAKNKTQKKKKKKKRGRYESRPRRSVKKAPEGEWKLGPVMQN